MKKAHSTTAVILVGGVTLALNCLAESYHIDINEAIYVRRASISNEAAYDHGGWRLMFDECQGSHARSANINPVIFWLHFDAPQIVTQLACRVIYSTFAWRVESADSYEDIVTQSGTYHKIIDRTGVPAGTYHLRTLGTIKTATWFRVRIQRTSGDNYVHISDFDMFSPDPPDPLPHHNVLMIIDTNLYNEVLPEFTNYIDLVEQCFPVDIILRADAAYASQNCSAIRDLIMQHFNQDNILGAVAVGQIDYGMWVNKQYVGNRGVCGMYYEDMDGGFSNPTNISGGSYYTWHEWGTNEMPELWLCWMRPPELGETHFLKKLLNKAISYYTDPNSPYRPVGKALYAIHEDWDGNFNSGHPNSATPFFDSFYGAGNVITDGWGSDIVYATHVLEQLKGNQFEIFDPWSHSSVYRQYWDSGTIGSDEYLYYMTNYHGAMFMPIWGCHSAAFNERPGSYTNAGNDGVSLAAAVPFGDSVGQAGSGTAWSYGTQLKSLVYKEMSDRPGAYLGYGWFMKECAMENPDVACYGGSRDPHEELQGDILIGNPFISLQFKAPPSRIAELWVSENVAQGVTVKWISTGQEWNIGTSTTFDIRYSGSDISNETAFAAATRVTDPPTPLLAGSTQSYMFTGLPPCIPCYCSIKAVDDKRQSSQLGPSLSFVPVPEPAFVLCWMLPAGCWLLRKKAS